MDFRTEAARAYVQQQFEQLNPARYARAGAKKGLRISSADTLSPRQIHG